MKIALMFGVLALGACARNDPELTNRISVEAALKDVAAGTIALSEQLLASNEYLGLKVCRISVNLALSANSTKDSKVGLAVNAPVAPGATVGGSGSFAANAIDTRANTAIIEYHNIDTITCPSVIPAAADPKGTNANAPSPTGPPGTTPTKASAPTAAPAPLRAPATPSGSCDPGDAARQKARPQKPNESRAQWYRELCPGTNFF